MPNLMRFHESCPDCGWIVPEFETYKRANKPRFDCPRCGAHYSNEDFLHELHEKHMAQHHNHAKADLTQEQTP